MKVFISSTYEDLKQYRLAAIEIVNRYDDCKPLAMEFFMANPGEPKKVCDKEIKKCDVFVGIYAHRYGFIPDSETKSITQLEYELAKDLGKDCLCFIVKEDFPWNPRFVERKKYDELEAFLNIVKKEKVVSFFGSAKDFESKFASSLAKFREEKQANSHEREGAAVPRTCIPIAPTPFIAHPYPLPGYFTGRDAEQAMLSNWFFNEKEPVLVLEAIGGMGKTALTWVWLHKQVLEPGVEIEGVFWWSFYESPFDMFIQQLACYVMGKEESGGTLIAADIVKLQAALHQRRFLLVLDGLERVLRGYSGMEAMFTREKGFQGSAGAETEWEKRQREPVHPLAAKFLPHLASYAGKTKTLITTRLMPLSLEDLAGVKPVNLEGLSRGDAVRFLRSQGVKGTRSELEQAGKVYGFHPLMLKLLASTIKRSRSRDVQEAFRLNIIDGKEPQKILTTGFNLLSKKESQVATAISVFRSVFTFDAARALFPKLKEDRLWQVMLDLQSLGFLLVDEKENRFDFHPIMRSFLYHSLTNRAEVHILAVQYFQALPKEKKIISLEDLAPVIELYHHLVKAGKFDDARDLFYNRINKPTYYQLSAYQLRIELLKELFHDDGEGEDRLPRLAKEPDQAWTLNTLANTYALSGQPARSVPLYLLQIKLYEKIDVKKALAISLGNIAQTAQFHIGQLSASTAHLRKSIALCREIEDEFREAVGHQELGCVLAFQGRVKRVKSDSPCAEEEWGEAFKLFEKNNSFQSLSVVSAYRSLSALLQTRLPTVLPGEKNHAAGHTREAVAQARKALEFAEKDAATDYPTPRDFVRAYWLLGEALLQCRLGPGPRLVKPFEIPFYDEHFQQQVETVKMDKSSQWAAAERCLTEALHRCRKVNLVESEPDILLAHARLEWAKISSLPGNRRCDSLPAIETTLKEALEIAQRAGYRLKLADLHLFCGQVLLQLKEKTTLLGLNAHEHLEITKDYALDASEFSHLYQSPNPDFYKGIPEYQMLKRGMTKEERIQNGYYVAYRIAEQLSAAV
ncbi:DUF4062 domain-containing protein [Acidobacteriota bacterium]